MPPRRPTGATWRIGDLPITDLSWGAIRGDAQHKCGTCGILLLTGEKAGFCCGPKGSRFHDVKPLPALPPQFSAFVNDPSISQLSRRLNLIMSFASLETTHPFPRRPAGGPSFLAIGGRVYHRVRPNHDNSAVRWLLYDGFEDTTRAPHQSSDWFKDIPPSWVDAFRAALIEVNSFASSLRSLGQLRSQGTPHVELILEDRGAAEIAAVMSYSNTTHAEIKARRLIVVTSHGENQSISTVSRFWEPLSYPLLFPHGTLGWGVVENTSDVAGLDPNPNVDIPTTQMWYYRARILREPRFYIFGRLANEYIVDMFSRNLETRLAYIRSNQQRLRQNDALLMGSAAPVEPSENIYLPSSFLGSWRWASEQVSDSLAIAAAFGPPTFFITMTCNPDWPEIKSQLRPGQTYADIPVVVVRVFKRKLSLLLLVLKTMFPNVGRPIYCIYCIEFQKRGLPHAHILIKYPKACIEPADIDSIVSAEMPDDPSDARLIRKYMMHSHPGPDSEPSSYCQRVNEDGSRRCRFHYPFALNRKTTIDSEGRVLYRRRKRGDEMVVPHILPLIREFECHINVDVANASHMFQYIFKYIHKPGCSTRYRISAPEAESIDEIKDFWDARYLSAGEAAWRILGYHVTAKEPAVTALPIHLPGSTTFHQYSRSSASVLSSLDRYFLRPIGSFAFDGVVRTFDALTYAEYFGIFRLAKYDPQKAGREGYFVEQPNQTGSPQQHVILRSAVRVHLSRIHSIRPSQGELFYLRSILQTCACRSFLDARTVADIVYASYQEAANALGLFADANEAMYALMEAVQSLRTPRELRVLFVHLLTNECVLSPMLLWEEFRDDLSRDFTLRNNNAVEVGINLALDDLGRLLEEYGKELGDYGLPEATLHTAEVLHELQRWSAKAPELEARANNMIALFKTEQRNIYTHILSAVLAKQPLAVFVDGKAGRGKTSLVVALCDKLRSFGEIVIPTATSAFAAQLYPGGRTTHSTFKVPVNEKNELLKSSIRLDSPRAELIRQAALIVWDEAPMANRAVLACVDLILREIMESDVPFGGKVLVLLGDFRQTCPVVRGGSRAQVVDASIKSSPLWECFTILRLTEPIRNAQDPEFADFVDAIGDGAGPDVSLHLLEHVEDADSLLAFVYPPAVLGDALTCLSRSILAPTNRQVDFYNDEVMALIEGTSSTYASADSFREGSDLGVLPPASVLDYVATNTPPGLPPHLLTIKTNAIFRLIRNLSIDRGLVKNARVVVTSVGIRLITVRLIRPGDIDNEDDEILIPRISFDAVLPSKHTLLRKQFPLAPAYATTFNSCQGLTLDRLGVDLTRPVFSHGQLYTALSRIRHRTHARIRLPAGETTTTNVTYPEILV